MGIKPSVKAAGRLHKAKELAAAIIVTVGTVLFLGAFLWGVSQLVIDSWKEQRAYEKHRVELAAAGAKSVAHHFLVSHWLQCNFQTRASCYSSIRGTAAASGDTFVRQVDAAAKDLGLI